jgi:acyl transferase domain-containing protein
LPPLAVVGIGCLFPGSTDFASFWTNVKNGVDAIRDVPATHWDPADYFDPDPKSADRVYAARGGFLDPYPFSPGEFGIAPNNLEATDTSQLLGLVAARQALADARLLDDDRGGPARARTATILGVTSTLELVVPLGARLGHPRWRRALREAGVPEDTAAEVVRRIGESYVGWQENSFPGLLGNVVAGRVANRFDLGGTNCVVDAACASSLGAVHLAALELASGRAHAVLTGGVDTFNDIFMFMCFSKTPALSPTGNARPFDAAGDGTVLGEGLGLLVLKRLADAERDGDRVYAVIRGVGTASDGKGNAVYAPKAAGQAAALRRAYAAAGITPDTVELVEAHGTGTKVGDATEATALAEVYHATGRAGSWCALGSIKSQIGHTKAAAGAAGLLKAVAALYHKVLPPTIKVARPLETLAPGTTPFYVNAEKRPWVSTPDHPRRAAVSAFGFGGSNFHVVVEEYRPEKPAPDWDGTVQLVPLAADTPRELAHRLAAWPADLPWKEFHACAADARRTFQAAAAWRLVLVVHRDRTDRAKLWAEARALLERAPAEIPRRGPEGVYLGHSPVPGKLALLFPGQGAQYVGMMRDLACLFPVMLDTLAEADQAFQAETGARLSDRIYPPAAFEEATRAANEATLRATDVAQPALGAVGLGALRVLEQFGLGPDAALGHSYGELVALCAAGRLTPAEMHRLSNLRGRLMAEAGRGDEPGAMLAVQAPADVIRAALEEGKLDLVLANKNAPRQTVLSGSAAAIDRAVAAFGKKQIPTTRLAVAAAFHSPLVAAAREPFRAALAAVPIPAGHFPVLANSTAAPYPVDAEAARDLLAGQLARPVEFVDCVERLYEDGVRTFLEVGPGIRLSGLVSNILEGRDHETVALDASAGRRDGIHDLACCLAALAARGHALDLSGWDPVSAEAAPAKTGLVVPICGANYVKPKPPTAVIQPSAQPRSPTPPMNGPGPRSEPKATVAASRAEAGAKGATDGLPPRAEGPPEVPTGGQAARGTLPSPPPNLVAPVTDASGLAQALAVTRESLAALQKMQEQTAQLHRQFLEGQEAAHRTVHLLFEQQQRLLAAGLGLAPGTALPSLPPIVSTPPLPLASPTPPTPATVNAMSPAAPVAPAPVPLPAANGGADQVERVLLEVIAEKTGYPAEMLGLDMALDVDLGIDSIKRVEILSALQERLPDAPAVQPEHLTTLHNLRQIVGFLANGAATNAERQPADAPAPAAHARMASEKVQSVLLEVIAEKTGYPAEMLGLDMALDVDLGIDSIKRVEILSALQERLPDAPAVQPEQLTTLHNLRQIVDFLANGSPVDGEPQEPHRPADRANRPRELPGDPDASPPLERSELRLAPLATRRAPVQPAAQEVWIVGDTDTLTEAIERQLQRQGLRPRRLSWAEAATGDCPTILGGLLLLAPAAAMSDDQLRATLLCVRRAGPALRAAGQRGGAFLATVSRLDGAFGLVGLDPGREPVDGGLAGLAKSAGQEWAEVHCKALDLAGDFAGPDDAATAIVEELLVAGPAEVGLSPAGRQMLERAVRVQSEPTGSLPFAPGDVVVVTGGARGVTAEVAVALARACRPTLVVLGRSPLPGSEPDWLAPLVSETDIKRELSQRLNGDATLQRVGEEYVRLAAQREVRENLARIEGAGARAVYRAVDVRDTAAVAAVLGEIRRELGPVRGLIHGAGVLADARIEDKTAEQFDRVYGTKVGGLRSLLAAMEPHELRALVLFSSTTARLGRTGQVDYAMANEVLNKTAQQLARLLPKCRALSVNWGPWDGGMVTPGLKRLFAREGVGLIPMPGGADFLLRELSGPPRAVEVVVLAGGVPQENGAAVPVVAPPPATVPPAFERPLSLEECPVLAAHVLNGRPVLPLALMVEWLGHGALHRNPGLHFHGIDGLRVLHGVVLESDALNLVVGAGKAEKRDGLYVVPVELRSTRASGREVLHTRAEVLLTDRLPAVPNPRLQPAREAYPATREEIYSNFLFHGPDLQGIERVDGCDARAISGRVRPAPSPREWLRRPLRQRWLADPLVLDAAFQLVILWGRRQHGPPSLPVSLGRFRQYRPAFPTDAVRVVATVARHTTALVTADFEFLDAEGRVVARLDGHESALDPGLERAFNHNRAMVGTE